MSKIDRIIGTAQEESLLKKVIDILFKYKHFEKDVMKEPKVHKIETNGNKFGHYFTFGVSYNYFDSEDIETHLDEELKKCGELGWLRVDVIDEHDRHVHYFSDIDNFRANLRIMLVVIFLCSSILAGIYIVKY